MADKEYRLPRALILNNDTLKVDGQMIYAPIYMVMFLQKDNTAPTYYKVDLSALQ